MKLPWQKEDPIEQEKAELALLWVNEEDEIRRQELIDRYLELDDHQLKREEIRAAHGIDAKSILSTGVTLALALLTLNFEKEEVLRSKVAQMWLRRRE